MTPFIDASKVWPSIKSTVGNSTVLAVESPTDLALVSISFAISLRAVIFISEAITSAAPLCRLLSTRSEKLPTALTAATAVSSAPPKASISPERQSRQN